MYDCDGHGTAVAGVAAGEQGIAPAATIVPLKVFGARDGCSAAWSSDVLAAVEWALDRREELGLEVLNLSLADDRTTRGFCDSEDPISAALFARARAEGVAVVAASGNGGRADVVAWPACLSDVVGVGMVYSAGQGPTSWNGQAQCSDAVTGPDVVPCASNGGAPLSLLAPGVRWLVPMAGGGRRTTFSGTSAAAPAAAGSLLLARAFSPARDPLLSASFLRVTGLPVQDDRSGRSTPRIDLGAAFFAPSAATGPCEPAGGPGPAAGAFLCRAWTTSLTGKVSTLAVELSIEHGDLPDLQVYLTGPDGTTIRLLNGLPGTGGVLRGVIGRTLESDEPLSIFSGRPADGEWALRVENEAGLAGTRIVSWSIVVEPETPRRAFVLEPPSRILPTVVRSAGLHGSFFETDVVLFNPDETAPAEVALSFVPAGRTSEGAVSVGVTVPPLGTRVLGDVVGNSCRSTGFGPVHVAAPDDVVVTSRTATASPGGGSYGFLVPEVTPDDAIGTGEPPAWLAPVFRPSTTRVNVGFAEVAGGHASVALVVRDGSGAVKGQVPIELGAFGSTQVNDVHRAAAVSASPGDLLEVRVLSGDGRVVAWAAAVDNGSNDGLLATATRPRRDSFLPTTAHSLGRFGAIFRTDLKVSNPWPSPMNVRISFFPSKGEGFSPVVLSLGAWETRVLEDVLASLLGARDDTAGALRLTVLGDSPGIVASSWTRATRGEKTYGLAIGVVKDAEAVPGERIALTYLSTSDRTRTNLGFLETAGVETILRVALFASDGTRLAVRGLFLEPNQAVQWNDVFAEMDVDPHENASAIVEVLAGGSVVAHAIRVDNRTNDASFVAGRVLRTPVPAASR